MKRIISLFMAIVMIMSVSAVASSAADTDMAVTSDNYQFSSKPYENISGSGVTVYGYLGDADGDKDISVMDATEIQLYCAQLTSLSNNALIVSDTDADGEISVMDATEIQLWAASLPANNKISHTVYTQQAAGFNNTVYDNIINYLYTHGEVTSYQYAIDELQFDSQYNHYYKKVDYSPNLDELTLYRTHTINKKVVTTLLTIKRDNPEFTFLCTLVDDGVKEYDAWGKASIVSAKTALTPDVFNTRCLSFSSDTVSDFSAVQNIVENEFTYVINWSNSVLGSNDIRDIYL